MDIEKLHMAQKQTGRVFRLQRFCVHDGDGIRTNVFFCGCPLTCDWCHNPEQGDSAQSRVMTAESVMDIVKKDRAYYETSGGGMTLSGGEPSFQPKFALALLTLAKEAGIAAAMETAGTGSAAFYRAATDLGCTFLCDIKQMNPDKHRQYCGEDNANILANISDLFQHGADIRIRMPLIPGCNDDAESIAALSAFLKKQRCQTVELMPYHNTASGKYAANGKKPRYERKNATAAEIDAAVALFTSHQILAAVSGR